MSAQTPPARPPDQYVDVLNVRTRYWALGEGEPGQPPLVLIHGLGGYVENWKDNVDALARDRRVYALDLIGFGRTAKPRVAYSLPYLAEFVHEFMHVMGIERPTLVGLSMGGGIALQFALEYPRQVEKLVIVDGLGMGRECSMVLRLMSVPLLGELLSRPSRKASAQLLSGIFHDAAMVTEELIEQDYALTSLPGNQRSTLAALRSLADLRGVKENVFRPVLDCLNEIAVPALVVWGEQDRILPVAHAHRAAERLPHVTLHIFDRCGHAPNIEHAPEFNALVAGFLAA